MKQQQPVKYNSIPGGDDITRAILPNGVVVLTRENFNSPSVVIQGYLPGGSIFDPAEKLGLAHFTATCLMRGTQSQTFQEIYDTLESVGASLGFGASVHNINFAGRSLAEDLPLLLELVTASVMEPTFPKEHVKRVRAQFLTHLAIREQDTEERASLALDEILFPNHPYGTPEDGYIETIQQIQREDLIRFQAENFGPGGAVIVVVGAVSSTDVMDHIYKTVATWRNPRQNTPPALPVPQPMQQTIRKHIPLPGKSQTDLFIGTHGPKRTAPEYLAASLGNNILGQFGMMGRIGDVVREQAGLAYAASTSLNAWHQGGSWEVSAGVNPANLDRAIDLIIRELERFVREPVSHDELQDSQANYIGRLPLSLESNAGVAGAILNLERFQLGLDYYRLYADRIAAISPDEILSAAQAFIHPEHLAIVSSGPELE